MIEIKNLTKIYDKSKEPVKALNGVSLVLPDKGLVFVLGKSGSGKSTFLNMIGGLDNVTKGDILLNGTSIVSLSNKDLDKYRNDYVGIIYQNFNLFPNETVRENILTSAIISNKQIDEARVSQLCEDLELGDKVDVLVKNLSGGQKQRVAIARALIKDPEFILADEPTGNLDSKTTKVIFNTLKKIAKEKLVLVISHDTKSAEKYADRIIYLSDGKVVDDVVQNAEYKELDEDSLLLPESKDFTEEEIKDINKSLKKHKLKVQKKVKKFIPFTEEIVSQKEKPVFKNKKGIFKLSYNVSNGFLKSTIGSFVVTLFLLTFIIGILSLSQSLAQFDGMGAVAAIASENQSKAFVVNKAYSYYNDINDINEDYAISVTDEDINQFFDDGYEGNIYKVYNTAIVTGPLNILNERGYTSSYNSYYKGTYSTSALGTAVCDYDYLKYLYGDLKVLAGSLYDIENNSKLIVTDYFADSILKMDTENGSSLISEDVNDPYQKITNELLWNRYRIGAIIHTGYKERYKELFDMFDRMDSEPQNAREIGSEIVKSLLFTQFYDELNSSLNFTYSVNEDFYNDYLEEVDTLAVWTRNCVISYNNNQDEMTFSNDIHYVSDDSLEDNTILLDVSLYNEMFDKNVQQDDMSDFEEKEIVISHYTVDQDVRGNPTTQVTLRVVGISPWNKSDQGCFGILDRNSYKLLAKDSLHPYALVFDNVEDSFIINDTAKNNFFYTTLRGFSAIFEVCNIVDIFSSIFVFIVIGLVLVELIVIISHNLRTIRKNQYRIGVYRGLGCSANVFNWASLFNTLILVLCTFVTSLLFVVISGSFINNILVDSFKDYINSSVVENFTFVGFSMTNLAIYMLIVLFVGGVSILAPVIKLKNLKPNLILNKAE